jgi:hypothetical protein
MADDDLTFAEVREIVRTGRIIERQRDRRTGERKYLLEGETGDGRTATVVTKFGPLGGTRSHHGLSVRSGTP